MLPLDANLLNRSPSPEHWFAISRRQVGDVLLDRMQDGPVWLERAVEDFLVDTLGLGGRFFRQKI